MFIRIMFTILTVATTATSAPLGTEFTYQGVLSDGGSPAAGNFDLRFIMYNADAGGSQVGPTVFVDDLPVSDGRVTTELDFGGVFDGAALWLEVSVREGSSSGSYTVLSPRQSLTAAPLALHAVHAETADVATTAGHASTSSDADTLDGLGGAHYLAWSNLTGKPGGLDDGDDDTLADLSCDSGEVAAWDGSAWNCASVGTVAYSSTAVVGPVGNPTTNGAVLIAAVGALPTPASEADGWIIELEPGEYDLGGFNLYLEDWISLRGADRLTTIIHSEVCGSSGSVVSLGVGTLSNVLVENTCGDGTSEVSAIRVRSASHGARIDDVKVVLQSDAGAQLGIDNSADGVWVRDVITDLWGSTDAIGIRSEGESLYLLDVIASASGTGEAFGVSLLPGATAFPIGGLFEAKLGTIAYGLKMEDATVDARDLEISGDVGAIFSSLTTGSRRSSFTGISTHGTILVWANVVGTENRFIIHRSRIDDPTTTIFTFGEYSIVRVVMSELAQGSTSGRVYCSAVVDDVYNFYPDTCP